jgi:serpin B
VRIKELMMRRLLFLFPILVLGLISCSDMSTAPEDTAGGGAGAGLSRSEIQQTTNDFAFRVFEKIVESEPDTNVVISPLSISLCMGMVQNGAGGPTLESMMTALGLEEYTLEETNQAYRKLIDYLMLLDPFVITDIANSVWHRPLCQPTYTFEEACEDYFDAEVHSLDFNRPDAAGIINQWVSDKTRGKITRIVRDPIPGYITVWIINTVYFKGFWTHPFDPEHTSDDYFHLSDGTLSKCRMMRKTSRHHLTACEGPNFYGVDMAYGDSLFSMTILLPKSGVSVDAVVGTLNAEDWPVWMDGFKPWHGYLEMPRFEIGYFIKLNDVLQSMGMRIFGEGCPDFSRMGAGVEWIDEVLHKTYIRVDERGTEAAAVTAASGASGIPPQIFIDRPFIFAIRENRSDTVLFIGKVEDPGYFD